MRRSDREVTDKQELWEIIEAGKVCHVAMLDGEYPYLVPLSFGAEQKEDRLVLYFHSAKEGKKLDVLAKNPNVCFEISHQKKLVINDNVPCASGCAYVSVIGMGKAEFVTDLDEKCAALSVLMRHQSGREFTISASQAENVCVFKIAVDSFTGKRKLM